jgi:hypothetical protein
MINNDKDNLTDTVTHQSKTISSDDNNETMPSTVAVSNSTGEEQPVQNTNNDQNNGVHENEQSNDANENEQNGVTENESHDKQLAVVPQERQNEGNEDDEFIRITAAHQMLTEGKIKKIFSKISKSFSAQTYDEQKNSAAALHLYRICVDLLLEELMFTEGTEQSRVYLREKCTAIMDRIDVLKTMLDPIPPPPLELPAPSTEITTTTTTDEPGINPPTDELNSVHIS